MKYSFTKFDNKEYYKNSTTSEVKALVYKIRNQASNSPFLNFDISKLIFTHLPLTKMKYNEEELKETIFDATWYFRKGNEEKIFEIITEKLKASR
ncbi:hypothetical protein [Xanthomarina sp. GH4-25]|uniref:hypothetical protein n=1 Tax=Xanthomarina sp. GH4-25 TaxID=3349335 RepID=UPI003877DD18